MASRPPLTRPPLTRPWALVATGLGTGYLPKAPGTWGSLFAAVAAWPIADAGGSVGLLVAALLAIVLGLRATGAYIDATGESDPGAVVVDEIAGQWIVLAACPLDPLWWLAGFVVFRILDVAKPGPVGWADRSVTGAWGVMLDDVLAGLLGAGVILIGRWGLESTF